MKRVLYFCLGLAAFLSLLCSVAAVQVTSEGLMTQGFLQFSQTAFLNVPPTRYADYASALCRYLDGKAAAVQVRHPDTGVWENAFSEKENAHLSDVRGIVTGLKAVRWAGGGLTIALLALLYFRHRASPAVFLADAMRGFAQAALALVLLSAGLCVWGAVDFQGLFRVFHQVAFRNDLWLLNPQTDLLLALMPLPFFTWYAGELLKALLPVLGIMLLVMIAWLRTGRPKKDDVTP